MAVYTRVSRADLGAFLARYDIGEATRFTEIVEGVENTNFRLETDKGRYVLTLFERRVRPRDLPFFLGLKAHLAQRGFPCPLPVSARDGAALQGLNKRPAAIVTFLDGRPVEAPGPHHLAELGRAMARMHLAAKDFPHTRRNDLSLDGWRKLADACAARPHAPDGLLTLARESLGEVAAGWPRGLPKGVVHADLFPDNVLWTGERITGVIDFYFSCTDYLAYDLAVALNAWCFDNDGAFRRACARALFEGYAEERPLRAAERAAFPILAKGAALRFLLTRLYDQLNQVEGAVVVVKDPVEYAGKLRFHARASGPDDYGL